MLALTRLDFTWRANAALRLPDYTGSTWRGAFGHALRERVCLTGAPDCEGCPLRGSCVYAEIFDTAPPADSGFLNSYPNAPHPYVMRAGRGGEIGAGETLSTCTMLFGRSGRHAGVVADAMVQAARRVGRGGALELVRREVRPQATTLPEAPAAARIFLETPLRLRVDNRYWKPTDFRFPPFFSTLLRRVTQLCAVHGEAALDADARALVELAGGVELVAVKLGWRDLERYSSRQGRKVPLGGLIGDFEIRGDLAPLWPWLWIGQWLHVGKGTVMGLGKYRLESVA